MNKKKILAIPIEFYQREFLLSVYLALKALKYNYQIIIGEQNEPIFNKIKNSLIYHKDHAPWSFEYLKKKRKNNNKIAILDVEGLIYNNVDEYINERVCEKVINISDVIFTWGENQKGIIFSTVANCSEKLKIIGSPKFDICNLISLKRIPSSGKVKKILINTRFSWNNSFRGGDLEENYDNELKVFKELGVVKNKKDEDDFKKYFLSEIKIYNEFISLIKKLVKNKKYQITIRPHPGENNDTYIKMFGHFENITVNSSESLNDQILQNDCLIHDGCTTAIEGRSIGIPVFGLRPENLENAYSKYANNYSLNFNSYLDLIDYIESNDISSFKMPDFESKARHRSEEHTSELQSQD